MASSDAIIPAGNSATQRVIGRPFESGNQFAFRKGQSGNPSGRPKGIIGKALLKQLRTSKRKDLDRVVKGVIKAAGRGNPAAFAHIRDTIDGKPEQTIEHKGEILHTLTAEERASAEDSLSRIVTYEIEDEKILLLPAESGE